MKIVALNGLLGYGYTEEALEVAIDVVRAHDAGEAEEVVNVAELNDAFEIHDVSANDFEHLSIVLWIEDEDCVGRVEVFVVAGLEEASEASLRSGERNRSSGAGKNLANDCVLNRLSDCASSGVAKLSEEAIESAKSIAHLLWRDCEASDVLS